VCSYKSCILVQSTCLSVDLNIYNFLYKFLRFVLFSCHIQVRYSCHALVILVNTNGSIYAEVIKDTFVSEHGGFNSIHFLHGCGNSAYRDTLNRLAYLLPFRSFEFVTICEILNFSGFDH